jgi:hypothetical protein
VTSISPTTACIVPHISTQLQPHDMQQLAQPVVSWRFQCWEASQQHKVTNILLLLLLPQVPLSLTDVVSAVKQHLRNDTSVPQVSITVCLKGCAGVWGSCCTPCQCCIMSPVVLSAALHVSTASAHESCAASGYAALCIMQLCTYTIAQRQGVFLRMPPITISCQQWSCRCLHGPVLKACCLPCCCPPPPDAAAPFATAGGSAESAPGGSNSAA